MLCVICHLSPSIYHLSLMPTATDPHPAKLAGLTPSLCTIGWFAKSKKKKSLINSLVSGRDRRGHYYTLVHIQTL